MIDFAKYRVLITGDFKLPGVNWDTGIVNLSNSELRRKANDLSQLATYLELYQKTFLVNYKGNVLDLFLTNDNECILHQSSAPLVPVDTWHVPFEVDLSIADNQGTPCPQATDFSYAKGITWGFTTFLGTQIGQSLH
ncbi:unnamed protein product [Ixodes persulcatus]